MYFNVVLVSAHFPDIKVTLQCLKAAASSLYINQIKYRRPNLRVVSSSKMSGSCLGSKHMKITSLISQNSKTAMFPVFYVKKQNPHCSANTGEPDAAPSHSTQNSSKWNKLLSIYHLHISIRVVQSTCPSIELTNFVHFLIIKLSCVAIFRTSRFIWKYNI